MAYEMKPNTGTLFKNDKRETDNHPEYNGSGLIDGVEYWFSAWVNESASGKKYFKISFKPKEAQTGGGGGAVQTHQPAAALDDDVPFVSADPWLERRVG